MSTLKVNTIQNTSGGSSSTPEQIEQGRAKAWIHFDGQDTVAIRDSFNVSSLTDNGTGDYTISFSTAMSNDNYAVSTMAASGDNCAFSCVDDSQAVGSCRVITRTSRTTGKTDFNLTHAIFFGDN